MDPTKFYSKKIELLRTLSRDLTDCQSTLEELTDHEDRAEAGEPGELLEISDSLKEAEVRVQGLIDAVAALRR